MNYQTCKYDDWRKVQRSVLIVSKMIECGMLRVVLYNDSAVGHLALKMKQKRQVVVAGL